MMNVVLYILHSSEHKSDGVTVSVEYNNTRKVFYIDTSGVNDPAAKIIEFINGKSNKSMCSAKIIPLMLMNTERTENTFPLNAILVNMPNIKSSLYNLNILNTCEYGEQIYICEGITDALSLNQIGKKALAVMGANNFKKEYIFLLKDYD